MKKTLLIILATIFITALAGGIWWFVANGAAINDYINGVQLYSHEDYLKANQDGYKAGFTDKQNANNLAASYREQVIVFNNQIPLLSAQKSELEFQFADLNSLNNTKQETITDLELQIKELNELIMQLEEQVKYMQFLLEAFDMTDLHVVNFDIRGASWDVQVISTGETVILVLDPINNEDNFLGWSLDGINIVDPTTIEITENTTFYAVFVYKVMFWDNRREIADTDKGNLHSEQFIKGGTIAVKPDNPKYSMMTSPRQRFNYWYIEGDATFTPIDIETYIITGDTVFIAATYWA